MYHANEWHHICTDRSQMRYYRNVGARIYSELFAVYILVEKHLTAYDGEVEATRSLDRVCLFLLPLLLLLI